MITFERVSKRYEEGHDALRDISVSIGRDELVFLTGHSGAGKSTMLRLIMLMDRPSRGQVIIDDQNLAAVGSRGVPRHRRNIGVVFQNHQLLFDRTVFDNVALPMVISGYQPREAGRRVRAALAKVGLQGKEKQFPMALSGGEQQRVGIARAVVNKPPILLADEPTGNLDPDLSREIMDLFQQFNSVGVTVLIASHDLFLIEQMGHRVLELDHGRLTTSESSGTRS
jgi:cell division transport system ATP-binding protein